LFYLVSAYSCRPRRSSGFFHLLFDDSSCLLILPDNLARAVFEPPEFILTTSSFPDFGRHAFANLPANQTSAISSGVFLPKPGFVLQCSPTLAAAFADALPVTGGIPYQVPTRPVARPKKEAL
jgi:hypothetical protein